MGLRNILIMFVSVSAISLVILIVLFSLFFDNLDLSFDTRIPESAPLLEDLYEETEEIEDPRAPHKGLTASEGSDTLDSSEESAEHAVQKRRPRKPRVSSARVRVPGDDPPPPKKSPENEENHEDDEVDLPRPSDPFVGIGVQQPNRNATGISNSPVIEDRDPPLPTPSRNSGNPKNSPPPNPPAHSSSTSAANTSPATPPLPQETPPANTRYRVYLDGFASQDAVDAKATLLRTQGLTPLIRKEPRGFVIQLGVFSNRAYADSLARRTGGKVTPLQ